MRLNLYILLCLVAFSNYAWAAKSDFIPLPGLWHFDKTISLPSAPNARCSIVFTNRKSNLEQDFDNANDFLRGLKGTAFVNLVCLPDQFVQPEVNVDLSKAELAFVKKYPANSSSSYTNRGKVKKDNLLGAEVLGFTANVNENNDTMQGSLTVRNDGIDIVDTVFTATRQTFAKGSKLRLFNFIKSSAGKKSKLTAGKTADFIAGVRSFGKTAMAKNEVITTIQLPEGITASDITVLSSSEDTDGLDCVIAINPGIPVQLQCSADALGPKNSLAKVAFRIKVPENADDLDIVVDSNVPENSKFERLQVNSRPARLRSKVGAAQRGKVACVVKGATPLKKTSGFTSDLKSGEGSAITSELRVLDNNRFIFSIGGTAGKFSTVFGLSGTMTGLPSFSTLQEGETHQFTSNDTRLSISRDFADFSGPFSLNNNDLDLGGNTGTGPFEGLLQLEPGTGLDSNNRTTVSGQFQIKVKNAVFTKVRGSKTREKTIPENTIICRFRDLRTK